MRTMFLIVLGMSLGLSAALMAAQQVTVEEAVSYTHLTLPTNREV